MTVSAPTQAQGGKIFVSPYAKKLATEKGIAIDQIKGTGPNQRIIAADVLEFKPQAVAPTQTQPKAAAAPKTEAKKATLPDESAFVDIENAQIRKVVAERLTFSKQNVPHYYVTIQVEVDRLLTLRTKLNNHAKSKISVNDMVIKAASLAALKVPQTNS